MYVLSYMLGSRKLTNLLLIPAYFGFNSGVLVAWMDLYFELKILSAGLQVSLTDNVLGRGSSPRLPRIPVELERKAEKAIFTWIK